MPPVRLSLVSHLQARLVSTLLQDIAVFAGAELRITVVSNLPEEPPRIPASLQARVDYSTNDKPRGFGANHNRIFSRSEEPFFCVLNPDLRFPRNPFNALLEAFAEERLAVVAPAAADPDGAIQDNARVVPTPARVAMKLFRGRGGPDYAERERLVYPEWAAGFFLLFRSSAFREMGGFDERYFMYYEDIDLCCRLRLAGWKVGWLPSVKVVHDARRHSHRDARHLLWHLRSIARFFASPVYRAARRMSAG